jgi:hypothetical protein
MTNSDQVYTFTFTLHQVNLIIEAMGRGEYLKVMNIINEFQRQIQAQEPPPPPKAPDAPAARANGADALTGEMT